MSSIVVRGLDESVKKQLATQAKEHGRSMEAEVRDILINNVCTFPSYRGNGHGSAAFEAVLEWARQTGVRRAELMATEDGRGIYEKAGFVVNGSVAMRAEL